MRQNSRCCCGGRRRGEVALTGADMPVANMLAMTANEAVLRAIIEFPSP
jgi:hypothetical protein